MRISLFSAITALAFITTGRSILKVSAKVYVTPSTRIWNDSTSDLGKKIFADHCAGCHKDTANYLARSASTLGTMTPRSILAALDVGKMKMQAATLSERERRAVSQWLTHSVIESTSIDSTYYTAFRLDQPEAGPFDYSGWGGNLKGTGFRSTKQAGITEKNIETLHLKWAFAFPQATIVRSKPAVVGDWLIVGGQYGDVFAINRHTGRPGWHFEASAAVRGAIAVVHEGINSTAYFADFSSQVYSINVRTGKLIWSARAAIDAQSSVTGSVAVYGGKVYVPLSSVEVAVAANGQYGCCTASGGVVALDAHTGKEIWRHRIIEEPARETGKKKNGKPMYGPSGAPVWCSPTVDAKRGLLYIGTGENYSRPTTQTSDAVQALDLNTGKLKWNFQATSDDAYNVACPFFTNCPEKSGPDFDFGMAPLLITTKKGKDILLAGQKSGFVFAIDPQRGKQIWKTRIGKGGMLGGIHWGMASDDTYLYVTNADNAVGIDKKADSLMPNPGIFAIDIATGSQIWKAVVPACVKNNGCAPFPSAAPAVIPGVVFAGSLDGHIRAYSSRTGETLWDFDTTIPIETMNGIKGTGGAIDGPAPVMADGMLFVNSGYGMFGQMPGNLLLAFEIKKLVP